MKRPILASGRSCQTSFCCRPQGRYCCSNYSDMLQLEDGATINGLFQAHSFEDRVLKTDLVFVRKGATTSAGSVLLYGAAIAEGATVTANSVVMKGEGLLANRTYEGCPIKER